MEEKEGKNFAFSWRQNIELCIGYGYEGYVVKYVFSIYGEILCLRELQNSIKGTKKFLIPGI